MKRIISGLASFLVLACFGTALFAFGGAEKKDTIVYALYQTPNGLFNPLIAELREDEGVNDLVYNSLIEIKSDHTLENALATSYKFSDDGKTLEFTLRTGVTWHDGTPFTAEDVVFTYESLADKDYPGALFSRVQGIKGAKDFQAGKTKKIEGIKVSGNKIILEFLEPQATALTKLATLKIIPKHIWSKVKISEWKNAFNLLHKPIGTGAYKLDKFESGSGVFFSANQKYFRGKPVMPHFYMKVFNQATVVAELTRGNVDIAEITDPKGEEVKLLEAKGIKLINYSHKLIQYMGFNCTSPILGNLKVRKAFAHAIDRKSIVKNLLGGHGVICNTVLLPSSWAYPKDGLIDYTRDIQKAKALMKEAGYTDTNGDGYLDKNGKKLSLALIIPTGDTIREQTGSIIQSNLKDLGIEIKLEPKPMSAVMDEVVHPKEKNYDLFLMGNPADLDPNPSDNWYSDSPWNFVRYINPKTDKLIDEGLVETNFQKRASIYHEFGKIVNQDLPWLPLYVKTLTMACSPTLKNYEPNTFVGFYNVHKWQVK